MRITIFALPVLVCVAMVSAEGSWTDLGDVPVPGTPIRLNCSDTEYSIDFVSFSWECGPTDAINFDRHERVWSVSPGSSEPPGIVMYHPVPVRDEDFYEMTIPEGVLRTGPTGDTLWTCIIDTVAAYEGIPMRIMPSASGGCWAVTGPEPGQDIWEVIRVSDDGELLSREEFQLQGGPVISMHSLAETPDGGLVMTGVTDSLGMNLYLVVLKMDPEGIEEWRVLEPFSFHASGDILEVGEDGCIIIAGYTGLEREDGWFMPPAEMDLLLMKLDPVGRELWRSVLPFPQQNTPMLMSSTEDGWILVLMTVCDEASSFPEAYRLVRFDPGEMQ